MNKTKTLIKKNKIAITFWLGTILITTGITLWLYTDHTIKTHQQILQDPNLTQQEKWKYQGSLEWWKKAALTTYYPTATALITLGTCLTETAIILLISKPQPKQNKTPKTKNKKKQHKITIIFIIGATLILAGITLSIYTDTIIKIHEEKLFLWNLTQEEKWQTEGSLKWWRMAKITIYDPAATLLIATGLITIVYAIILAIKQPTKASINSQNPQIL